MEFGANEAGQGPGSTVDTLVRVPVRYGDASRQAQTILQNNSASDMPATPLMTFYITDLKYDRPRMQEPYYVQNMSVRQRTYDPNTDSYETTQGNAFTIERAMPVPYEMTINLDIWTSNTNQKMQLLEQILTLFNPSLEIQSTDNYIDWTSLTVLYLKDVRWSSRVIPMNADNPIDIATLSFTLPMWITPPAKVKKLGVIERIITSVYDAQGDLINSLTNSDLLLGTRQKFTPFGYQVLLVNNKLQALRQQQVVENGSLAPPLSVSDAPINATVAVNPEIQTLDTVADELANLLSTADPILPTDMQDQVEQAMQYLANIRAFIQAQLDAQNNPPEPPAKSADPLADISNSADPLLAPPNSPPSNLLWHSIINLYGTLRPGISYITLEQPDGTDVSGTVAYDPTDDRFLLFTINTATVPANTLPPITAVIDPLISGPGSGLPAAAAGQRYLLTQDTGAWSNPDGITPVAWEGTFGQPLVARANDIIEFDGQYWQIAFDRTSSPNNIQYITNLTSELQYRWTGTAWVKSYQGLYPGGNWSLVL